jgi:glycosyltransferase involved in cell wall biosynthesis
MLGPPWIPIPPPGYGGIEAVLALLCDALVDRGLEVELFCAPGSRSRAQVRPLLEEPQPGRIERALFEADHVSQAFAAIDAAARAGRPFDVVHDHCGFTALAMADRLRCPLVHTVHGPFDRDTSRFYARHGHKGAIVCISRAQALSAPRGCEIAAVVPNPVEVEGWPVSHDRDDYLLWVGRMTEEKGPHRAARVARAAGRRLILAGPVQPGQERFFKEQVSPHVDGARVRYVGEVGGHDKRVLFARADGFLMPIRWPEPFGVVIVEALAAGTPVISFPCGAAGEIITHGETGFLVQDEEEMAAAVARLPELDPASCRAAAGRFAPGRAAALYEQVYEQAVKPPARSGEIRAAGELIAR